MGQILLLQHEGDPPSEEQLRRELALGAGQQDYTYLVATLAQEGRRKALAPPHQLPTDGEPHLVFHKALRLFLAGAGRALLTRAEERVLLQRAVQSVARNPAMERVLRHDVFTWRDGLMRLAEEGIDLSGGVPPAVADRLVSPGVGGTAGPAAGVSRRSGGL